MTLTSDLKFEPLFILIYNISARQNKYLKKQGQNFLKIMTHIKSEL